MRPTTSLFKDALKIFRGNPPEETEVHSQQNSKNKRKKIKSKLDEHLKSRENSSGIKDHLHIERDIQLTSQIDKINVLAKKISVPQVEEKIGFNLFKKISTWQKIKSIQNQKKSKPHEMGESHSDMEDLKPQLSKPQNPIAVTGLCLLTGGLLWGGWVRKTLFELSFILDVNLESRIFSKTKPYTQYFRYTDALRFLTLKAEKQIDRQLVNHTLLKISAIFPPFFMYLIQKSVNEFIKESRAHE